jgi:hypothetical protein
MKHAAAIVVLFAALCSPFGSAQALYIGLPDKVPETGTPPAFKYLHFLAGLALGLSAAELVHGLPLGPAAQQSALLFPAAALTASAVGGIGKELLDLTGFGDPAVADVIVTMSGGLAAAAVVSYAQSLYPAGGTGGVNEASFLLSSAAVLAIPVVVGFIGEVRRFIERRARARYE